MATLHLMVGLPCSGKTTLAKQIEQEQAALRLTPDEWHKSLFGNDVKDAQHDTRHTQIEMLLWGVAARALALGMNVILDFGFWAKVEREDYRARAKQAGAASEIHFLDVSEEDLFERLRLRNAAPSAETFCIPEEDLKSWLAIFQPPGPEELERRE